MAQALLSLEVEVTGRNPAVVGGWRCRKRVGRDLESAGTLGQEPSGAGTDGKQGEEHPFRQPVTSRVDQSMRGLRLVGKTRIIGFNKELNKWKLSSISVMGEKQRMCDSSPVPYYVWALSFNGHADKKCPSFEQQIYLPFRQHRCRSSRVSLALPIPMCS